MKYVCMHCEYAFDPEKGDANYNIAPGTYLEDLPDDWACPECGVRGKDAFIIEDD